MKKNVTLFVLLFILTANVFSQSNITPFTGCPSVYVVGFKNGLNCTADAHKVYTMDLAGNLSATPLFTTTATQEINSIGISSKDNKGYAMFFDRLPFGSNCINGDVKLLRFGANGATEVVGTIPTPSGIAINTALGAIDANGTYIFGAFSTTQFYVGKIANVHTLAAGSILTAVYTAVNNSCEESIFADWAINPADGQLYMYGVYDNGGIATGTLMQVDLVNNKITCLGNQNLTEFTNPAQDNFGGIMFGADGFMYGVNVNTRKFYKINPTTGDITYISTIPGSGQLRGDMGSCASSNPTPPTPFANCPNVYVVNFKNGFNCTASSHNVYTMDLAGNLSATPLFSTPDTIELNGIGISRTDNKGYALLFRRIGSGGSFCLYDTVKLLRFGANGATEVLGPIPPPPGGYINTALGTVDANGTYLFGAFVGAQLYLGRIPNVQGITADGSTVITTYTPVTQACDFRIFADWAINPVNGQLYSYGIFNNAGVVTGTSMMLNVTTNQMTCVGNPNTSEFFDAAQDNFGGIMFGADGFMYGVNVNTRKFYKINATSGEVSYVSTIPNGTGQLRGDMGSCVAGNPTILPIGFTRFVVSSGGACKAAISWQASGAETGDVFDVEKSYDGLSFFTLMTEKAIPGDISYTATDAKPAATTYYRIKSIGKSGEVKYSSVQKFSTDCGGKNQVVLYQNPIAGQTLSGEIRLDRTQPVVMNIFNAAGMKIFSKTAVINAGVSRFNYTLSTTASGVYLMQTVINGETINRKFMVQ